MNRYRIPRNTEGSEFWIELLEPKLLLSAELLGGSLDGAFFLSSLDDEKQQDDEASLRWANNFTYSQDQHRTDASQLSPLDLGDLSKILNEGGNEVREESWNSVFGPNPVSFLTHEVKSTELIIIDTQTEDYLRLLESVSNRTDVHYTIHLLDPEKNGISQISALLNQYQDLDAVHLISHGREGQIQLGHEWLSINNIDQYQEQISGWHRAFASDADLLLYGCDIAGSTSGEALITRIGSLTQLDVAASNNSTGTSDLGGDWQLEFQYGEIKTSQVLLPSANWSHLLGPPGAVSGLWLSTASNVAGATTPGATAWSAGEILEFGDADFTLEPGLTSGTLSSVVNMDNFNPVGVGGDNSVSITGMHYVTSDMTVGSGNSFNLKAGDLLLATDETETLSSSNTLTVGREDVFVFRPDTANNYSTGTFYMLVEDLATSGEYLTGISLVENTLSMGSRTLTAGSIIFSQINEALGRNPNSIYHATIDQAGTVSSSTTKLLVDGSDISIAASFTGLELIDRNIFIGGENISAGNILVTISGPDTVGDNNISATAYDVIALNVTQTTDLDLLGIPILSAAANASIIFEGADINFSGAGFEMSALTLVESEIPAATNLNQSLTYTEGDAQVALADIVVTDINANDVITATLTLTNVDAGSISTGTFGASSSTYNVLTGVWSVSGTISDVNAALASAAFVPAVDGDVDASIITHIEDAAANSPADGIITLDVTAQNDAPNASNLNQTIGYTEGDSTVALTDIVISDVDTIETVTATLTLLNTGAGFLSVGTFGGVTSTYNTATGIWTATGSIVDVNAALASVTFAPTTNNDVNTSITTHIQDAAGTGPVDGSIALNVTPVNDDPTLDNLLSDQMAMEDTLFSVSFPANTFSDLDTGDILTYTAELTGGTPLPSWLTFTSGTRTFSGTPLNGDVGVISVTVYADDGNGGTPASDTFSITINNTNDAPSGAVTIDGVFAEDQVLTVNTSALSDDDGLGAFSYQWLRDAVAISGETGTTYTLGDADVGSSISVQVNYTDLRGAIESVLSAGSVAITNINDAPSGVVSITGTATLGETLTASNNLADDDGLGTITYQWQQNATNIVGATGSTYVIVAGDIGNTINVVATYTDDNGTLENVSSTATATVTAVNNTPTGAVVITGLVQEDSLLTVDTSTLNDADGLGAFSYQWQQNGINIAGATNSSYTPGDADVGTSLKVVVIYTDGFGTVENVVSSATAAVANINDAPTATQLTQLHAYTEGDATVAINDIVISDIDNGETVTAVLTLQDVAAGTLTTGAFGSVTSTYNSGTGVWTATGSIIDVNAALAAVAFAPSTNNDVNTAITTHIEDAAGVGPVNGVITLNVTPVNDNPSLINSIANQVAEEGSFFSFSFPTTTFTDVDTGDTLTYTAQLSGGQSLPGWLSFDAGTRTFSGTPTNGDVGTISVTVLANDGNGGVPASTTFSVLISNTNDNPTLNIPIGNQTAVEDTPFILVLPSDTFLDLDSGARLTYTATLNGGDPLPSWLQFNGVNLSFSGTPGNDDVGTIEVSVIADDGQGGSPATAQFSIVVLNTNDDPVLTNAIPDQQAIQDTQFNFTLDTGTFTDDDSDSLSYTLRLANGETLPNWLLFDESSLTLSGTPGNADVGTIELELVADDNNGGSPASALFKIDVLNVNDPPILTNIVADQTISEDQFFVMAIPVTSFTDPDGDNLSYRVQLSNGDSLPGWLEFDSGSNTLSGTPLQQNVGTLTLSIIASDNLGGQISSNIFTLSVLNQNDSPTGSIHIVGDLQLGQTVIVDTSLLQDEDGVGELSFQWFRDGSPIVGATNAAYAIQLADSESQLSVSVSYLDNFGMNESLNSQVASVPRIGIIDDGLDSIDSGLTDNPNIPTNPTPEISDTTEDSPFLVISPTNPNDDDKITPAVDNQPGTSLEDSVINNDVFRDQAPLDLLNETDNDQTQIEQTSLERSYLFALSNPSIKAPEILDAQSTGQYVPFEDPLLLIQNSGFLKSLDDMQEGMKYGLAQNQIFIGSSLALSAGLSAGYIAWLARSGVLLTSVLGALPAWRFIDPLPVLNQYAKDNEIDDESLQSIVEEGLNDSLAGTQANNRLGDRNDGI